MVRSIRRRVALLGVLALLGGAFLVPDLSAPVEPAFRSFEEARAFLLGRSSQDPVWKLPGDPYAASYLREYQKLDGSRAQFRLLHDPVRELALAEGFRSTGFHKQALYHYEVLLRHHPRSQQARNARTRIGECRSDTVLGLVAGNPLIQGPGNLFFVPARRPLEASIDEILQRKDLPALAAAFRKPLLPAAAVPGGPLFRVGRYSTAGELKREAAPVPVSIEDLPRGPWYAITQPESSFTSETIYKLACLAHFPPSAGVTEELALLGASTTAPGLAAVRVPEALNLDALWTEAVQHNARFTLQTTNALSAGVSFPVTIKAANVDSIRFHVERVEGTPPAQFAELNAWVLKSPAASVAVHEIQLRPGTQTVDCPLPAPGIHRVTASWKTLSCRFVAVRSDLQAQALVSSNNSALLLDRGGLTLSRGSGPLVRSDERGLALLQEGAGRSAVCEEHRSCCSTCSSCDHHHGGSGAPLFVSGLNHAALLAFSDLPSLPPVPAVPLLFLGTDRPVYKAGDTLRFRGIARIPKARLDGSEPSRHDPAPGQTVRVVASQNKAAFFERDYSTSEVGTFHGEIPLPLSAARTTCELTVHFLGRNETLPFEIRDYKKTDFAVLLSPGADGVRFSAGYVWGLPVPGARVDILVDGRPTTPVDGRVEARDGQRVQVQLRRGDEVLASQALTYHAPAASSRAESPAPAAVAFPAPEVLPPASAPRELRILNRSGKDTIVLELEAPADLAEALLVLGDVQIYEVARVPLREGRGRASFPVRHIYDPQVAAFAFAGDLEARTEVALRNRQLPVRLELPAKARPGDTVELKVHSQPGAYFSVAAVDEAIFALRADETPALYQHFHPVRPASLRRARRPVLSLPGEQHHCEQDPQGDFFRSDDEIADTEEYALVKGLPFEVMGAGGGGGGRFGGRFGGRSNLVARGGGAMASESVVDRALLAFARLQRPDGLWDGSAITEAGTLNRRGSSALTLLAFLGAGYSHLSKDTHEGFVYGDLIRKAFTALMQQTPPQPGDALLNDALVQLAIGEAWGMTASELYRPAAEAGLAALLRRQSPDGGWHRSDPTQRGEASATTFAVMAIKSAQIGGLEVPAAPAARALSYAVAALPGAKTRAELGGLLLSAHFLRKDDEDPVRKEALARLVALGHGWGEGDALGAYLGSLSLFQHDGPAGPAFTSWRASLLAACTAAPGGDAPPAAAFRVLSMQLYYRYSNVFGSSRSPEDERPLAPLPRIRIHFPDTALWEPELVTDARGEARIRIPLGDDLTTTRVTARGITRDGAAGEALAQVTTEQPFFIKLKSPEFAVAGDEIEVRAELYHTEQAPRPARVTLEGHGTRETELRPGEPAAVSWRVPVRESGLLVLRARASAGGLEDAVERRLPVLEPGRESRSTQRELLTAGRELRVTPPEGARELTVRLHPRRAPLTRVLDALRYLTEYPHG